MFIACFLFSFAVSLVLIGFLIFGRKLELRLAAETSTGDRSIGSFLVLTDIHTEPNFDSRSFDGPSFVPPGRGLCRAEEARDECVEVRAVCLCHNHVPLRYTHLFSLCVLVSSFLVHQSCLLFSPHGLVALPVSVVVIRARFHWAE